MRAVRSSIILTSAALSASVLVGLPGPRAQVGPGELVYSSSQLGTFEVFRIGADGSGEPVNLSRNDDAHDLDPAWSADGTRVVFARTRTGERSAHLYVMDEHGDGLRRLTSGPLADRQPAWGPDGQRIAFVRSAPPLGTSRIFTVRADGINLRRLTDTGAGVVNAAPSWSPDGTRLAFSSDRRGGVPQIYSMDPYGAEVRRLTRRGYMDTNPAWSPDGTRIVFERCCRDGVSEIILMNADGTGQVNLTPDQPNQAQPAWSPDGTRLAYVTFPRGGGDRSIWTMDLSGGDRVQITSSGRAELGPDWRAGAAGVPQDGPSSPDGEEPSAGPAVGPAPSGGAGPGRIRQRVRRVAPGVRLIRRIHRRGPTRVFALEVDVRRRPSLDVALGGGRLLGVERVRSVARRHGALAAVNGDFSLPGGRPAHVFAEDGHLRQSSFHTGPSFAVAANGRRAFMRDPTASVTVREAPGDVWDAGRWNFGAPVLAESAVYSAAGAGLERSPRGACAARLRPVGALRWGAGRRSVERSHVVGRVGCFRDALPTNGQVVVAARPGSTEALLARSLERGSTVTLEWSVGFRGVLDSIGGYPLLVRNGRRVVGPCGASICGRHPRTAIGVKGNGRVLLVVVDGRRPGWSVGMTLDELARELRRMGARRAMNLDGGGSSTMVLRGRVLNRPSDGSPRAVSSAVMVMRGRDPREQAPLPPGSGGSPPGAAADATMPGPDRIPGRRIPSTTQVKGSVLDPASTGGFLEAVEAGAFGGGRVGLPLELRQALRDFRRGRR